jgi:hypothetical protein
METIQQNKAMMVAMLQDVAESPVEATRHERFNRLKMLLSEVGELAEAYGLQGSFLTLLAAKDAQFQKKYATAQTGFEVQDSGQVNLLEVLDAHVDIRVIADGGICQDGLVAPFQEAVNEVFASNMSKPCDTQQEAEEACEWYRTAHEQIVNYRFNPTTKKYVLFDTYGKFKKRPSYREARLWAVLSPFLTVDQAVTGYELNQERIEKELAAIW